MLFPHLRQHPFWRDASGVAAIEFALLALPFFLIVFCLLETSVTFLAEVTMDNAVQKVARDIRVGSVNDLTEQSLRDELCRYVGILFNCGDLYVDLRSYPSYEAVPTVPPLTNGHIDTADFGFDVGEGESIMTLRVYYAWPIFTDFLRAALSDMADGSHLIAGQIMFKNEPF